VSSSDCASGFIQALTPCISTTIASFLTIIVAQDSACIVSAQEFIRVSSSASIARWYSHVALYTSYAY